MVLKVGKEIRACGDKEIGEIGELGVRREKVQIIKNMNTTRRDFIHRMSALVGISLVAPGLGAKGFDALPNVLILGDSISIGYTPYVQEILAGEASVVRPAENCQGTTHGLKNTDKWLGDTKWDVIHFNFGLHDLKHVDPVTRVNSNDPGHPQQADVKQYAKNLKVITEKLKATGAKLIFATTTPYPDKPDGPLRMADQPGKYNKAALRIMKKHKVAINDLYAFTLPQMSALQIPNNVHFTKEGSRVLAEQVVASIRNVLRS